MTREIPAAMPADQSTAVSPLAPVGGFPELPAIDGVTIATGASGVRYHGRDDVMVASIAPGSTVAGVFTRSSTRSESVRDCAEKLALVARTDQSRPFGLLACAGNANTFTGKHGRDCVELTASALGRKLGTSASRVFTAFTGVIGERLPVERVLATLDGLDLAHGPERRADGFERAAAAITTTDTFPKGAGRRIPLGGREICIAGIAKGSGMIAPDMATMLAFVFSDAKVDQDLLQRLVGAANETTFNSTTVDGDTSTSDTLIVAATGRSGVEVSERDPAVLDSFGAGLECVMLDLAQQVIRDGEGATKFVEIEVRGGASPESAKRVAMAIANSPLVKTAISGEDPNWGRIVMAVGKSGEAVDPDRLTISMGDTLVASGGESACPPDEIERIMAAYMRRSELRIVADVGVGSSAATVWTCDLSKRYVEINADYRS